MLGFLSWIHVHVCLHTSVHSSTGMYRFTYAWWIRTTSCVGPRKLYNLLIETGAHWGSLGRQATWPIISGTCLSLPLHCWDYKYASPCLACYVSAGDHIQIFLLCGKHIPDCTISPDRPHKFIHSRIDLHQPTLIEGLVSHSSGAPTYLPWYP